MNEVLIHATISMNFENLMVNEKSQTQKATYCITPLYETPNIGEFIDIK